MVGVSLLKNEYKIFSLLEEYAAATIIRHEKNPYSQGDLSSVISSYYENARAFCYIETSDLFQKIAQIEQHAGPVFETAQKVQRAIQPIVDLCAEGKERIELAKRDPASGPRACHWLAMHLNALNEAAFKKDRNAMVKAVEKIDAMQSRVAAMPKINERTKLLNELCEKRLNQLGYNQATRQKLFTWSGYLKDKAWGCLAIGALSAYPCFAAFRGMSKATCLINSVNWQASLNSFLTNCVSIGSIWRAALFREPDLTIINGLTLEEKEKLARLQKEILTVASAFQIPENISDFIEIVDVEGTVAVAGSLLGNSLLRIPKSWFDEYESMFAQEWKEVLSEMPDHPIDLGCFLDQANAEKRSRIYALLMEHEGAVDQKMMQGVVAHEFGHLRNHDVLSSSALFDLFEVCLRFAILYMNSSDYSKWNGLVFFALSFLIKPTLCRTLGFLVSQYKENRADHGVGGSSEYNEGLLTFFKKSLVCELVRLQVMDSGISSEEQVQKMVKSLDLGKSHPNYAKRMLNAIDRRGKTIEPSSQLFSAAKVALIAGIHLALLATGIYQLSHPISELY